LILSPAETANGGVTNYCKVLKDYFSISVYYQYRGSREWPYRGSSFSEGIRLIKDYLSYFINVIVRQIQIVHINTSLSVKSVLRDLLFTFYAKILGKKCIVFFHGWSSENEKLMQDKYKWLLKLYLHYTDALITLSKRSQHTLKSLGYKKKIYIETTLVDDNLLKGFDINKRLIRCSDKITLLFLARLEKEKGIFDIIDACELITQKGYSIRLLIAGKGRAEKEVLSRVKSKKYIEILGYVTGEAKAKSYQDSDIYILPSYTEGMPISVLEAMAFGLPVIVTPVGGLQDIIKEGINGYFVPIANSTVLAETIVRLVNNKDLINKMSLYNYSEAHKYYASNVVIRIENIYKGLLE